MTVSLVFATGLVHLVLIPKSCIRQLQASQHQVMTLWAWRGLICICYGM